MKRTFENKLILGNLDSSRDWGHSKDYVKAMHLIMSQKEPDDYVIATGLQYSIKQFINLTAKELKMRIFWKGKGIKEKGYDEKGNSIIECDINYLRPMDVNTLLGDSKKARTKLKWKPKTDIKKLIKEMIYEEMKTLLNDKP